MTTYRLPGEPVPRLRAHRPGPKGLAPYAPRRDSKAARLLRAAEAVLEREEDRGGLPLGSRETAYEVLGDEFDHDDVPYAEQVIERARRAGLIPWPAISDGRTSSAKPWAPADGVELADQLLDQLTDAQLDRQADQANRVEVWPEAAGWSPRLERICGERGVAVFSGSGSVPVAAVRGAAIRAINSFARDHQRTVLLQIGDFDLNGLRNIARPFEADVRAMARDLIVEAGGPSVSEAVLDKTVVVQRLLLTADQVADLPPQKRTKPTQAQLDHGWPWPWMAQAEAMPPADRDRLVAEAIDGLHNVAARDAVVAREPDLHDAARRALVERLNGDEAS